MMETDLPDCPLCMELYEIDDLHFYPCTCGYQICRFCWHRIRTDGNGLCPACRKTYTEDPAIYRPLSQDEIQKIKKERKQVEAQRKQKISDNRQHLSNIRVIQRHLVFVVGLSNKMADAEVLRRPEYFGMYGKIVKIVINPNTNYAGPQGPSASAYITYTKEDDALKAILSINNMQPTQKIRASLGTTKYCTHYLRSLQCQKADCMYLHDVGDGAASFTKEDMQAGKHQLFEKNLLDNYMANCQQQTSKEASDQNEQTLEDWGDEVENVDSLLPSQASWGTNSIDKLVSAKNISAPTTAPTVSKEQPEEEYPEIRSSIKTSTVVTIASNVNQSTVTKKIESISPTVSQSEAVLKTTFSTGWATSNENAPSGPAPVSNDHSNFSWPGVCDLGLSDLKILPADDDLGFDPFNESKTGLEDLMATERQQNVKPSSQSSSLSWDAFWPMNYSSNQNSKTSLLNSYSLFGASQQLSNPHMLQYRAPSINNPYQSVPNPQLHGNPQNPSPFRFLHPSQPPRFPVVKPPQMHNQHLRNQFCFQPPPTQSLLPNSMAESISAEANSIKVDGGSTSDNKNWQDGLRALLPNINISFSNQQLEKKLTENWPDSSQTNLTSEVVSSPPPGFGSEKAATRPPPGFGKSKEPFSPSSQPPGLHNTNALPISTQATSVPPQSTHDDPSILWSKVLKDQNKELETTNMAFPLPGETIKQGLGSDPPLIPSRVVQQQSLAMTSWNTIVSGSQASKSQSPEESHQQPLHITSEEIVDGKPQKPSPIFGNHQKHTVKKPTAHVKPLKCNIPSDGFTTVQSSRQAANYNSHGGTRMNELDDFTSDLPTSANPNIMPNLMNNLAEYPPVAATVLSKSANKRKKRKGKEQIEHVSEIIVGRVETEIERPTIPIVDDERPKKSNKTRKKSIQKTSPLQQRKSPPVMSKYEHQKSREQQQQQQQIRILKSDGNTGTTSPAPTQVLAASEGTNVPVTSSSPQDHEIVSRLTESTEKLLKNVLFETEAIKLNTEQISKDLKSALEKCKESSLSLSDLEKINLLLTPGKLSADELGDSDLVDTSDLERQVESARREAKLLEARLNDVIRKNMASEMETLKRNTKNP